MAPRAASTFFRSDSSQQAGELQTDILVIWTIVFAVGIHEARRR